MHVALGTFSCSPLVSYNAFEMKSWRNTRIGSSSTYSSKDSKYSSKGVFLCSGEESCTAFFFFLLPNFRVPLWVFSVPAGAVFKGALGTILIVLWIYWNVWPSNWCLDISDNFFRSFLIFLEMYSYHTSSWIFSSIGSWDEDPWTIYPRNSSSCALASTRLACSACWFRTNLDRLILPSLYCVSTQSLKT